MTTDHPHKAVSSVILSGENIASLRTLSRASYEEGKKVGAPPLCHRDIDLSIMHAIRLGLAPGIDNKNGPPSPRAEAGQENIETVHEPKPIQTAGSP